ncbi:4-hydroxythreonine-4-phosphate dehydrogenase 2 [Bacteroidales bacterium]|nr:4-hydroxythreonine-4-phosphate dehydrogenase 2 [Bacteroidales bacterium]
MSEKKVKIGITHGDINGIGYEVILKTFADDRILDFCIPIIYGSGKIAAYHRKALDLKSANMNVINHASEALPNKVNVINCVDEELKVEYGKVSKEAGRAAFLALERASEDLDNKSIDTLLTAPINKYSIQGNDFDFPGHTEYLEHRHGNGQKALMILTSDDLRVALVTGHMPLSEISSTLSTETILEKLLIFNQSLKVDFCISAPRIAVLSLNPHAGEEGLLGTEERDIISPAMAAADKKGILCFGPFAADGFFGSGAFSRFDGVLAMYHDQGLIPFKTMVMGNGVNFTAGLPIIRTSPDHGTACDIAGQNKASEKSFRNALYLGIDIFRNRNFYQVSVENPLKRQYYDRGGDNERLDLTKEDA